MDLTGDEDGTVGDDVADEGVRKKTLGFRVGVRWSVP
jgi:hypothetical protein